MAEDSIRRIGGVVLDYSRYPGEDYYCDGDVEEELLTAVKDNPPEAFSEIIRQRKDWPTLYHLSPVRGNIVDWIPFRGTEKVLEIGSGPGAITEKLAAKAGSVTCVDLSSRRSMINAYRNRDRNNITIHVGNFADIEPDLPSDYDYIFLIGVFEYARSYMDVPDAFHTELRRILPHLKKNADGTRKGRLVIAIENRLGLKYFAGCREDHTQKYFDGITSYENRSEDDRNCPATFSRPALEKILADCGVTDYSFGYPYPDYKFMSVLYSDRRLPDGSELTENIRNFDRDRLLLFDEKQAYDGIVEDGLFPLFSNSFELVIGRPLPVIYAKYSNDRAPQYRIVTQILEAEDGTKTVRKAPADEAAREHVAHFAEAYEKLKNRYGEAAGALAVCPCRLQEDGSAVFSYVEGRTLESLLDGKLENGDREGFFNLLALYAEKAGANETAAAADPDMTFANIIVGKDGTWTAIDYEWEEDRALPAAELLARALHVYSASEEKRGSLPMDELQKRFGISEEDLKKAAEKERDFQQRVSGGQTTLGELRAMLGTKVTVPTEIIVEDPRLQKRAETEEKKREIREEDISLSSVQVYYDTGSGFSEKEAFFLKEKYGDENRITFSLDIPEGVRKLRIDPALCPCFVLLNAVEWNGQPSERIFVKHVKCSGRIDPDSSMIFTTDDPWMVFDLDKIRRVGKRPAGGPDHLSVTMQMCGMPATMAKKMKGLC